MQNKSRIMVMQFYGVSILCHFTFTLSLSEIRVERIPHINIYVVIVCTSLNCLKKNIKKLFSIDFLSFICTIS